MKLVLSAAILNLMIFSAYGIDKRDTGSAGKDSDMAGKEHCTMDNPGYDKPMALRPGYKLVEELSDEFNGNSLDKDKWVDHMTYWKGRGSEFLPSNISVGDGYLKLKSSVKDEEQLKELYTIIDTALTGSKREIDVSTWSPADYGEKWDAKLLTEKTVFDKLMQTGMKSIGAAAVMSKNRIAKQGYYEARIKASNISLSTAFWLQGGGSEFDITESYGNYTVDKKTPWYTNKPYLIALSTWWNSAPKGTPAFKSMEYLAAKKVSDEFFVLGFLWGDTEVKVYYNDKEILSRDLRGVPEIDYKVFASLKHVIFDTEILWGPYFGWPTKNQLTDPKNNTFYVDWLRVWEPVK